VKVNDGKEKVEPIWLEANRRRLEAAAKILGEIETAKAKRTEYEGKIEALDLELIALADRHQVIADELDEAMTLTGIRRPKKPKTVKPRDPNAPVRKRTGPSFITKVLELLYRDGGSYSIEALVEDFGGTKLAAQTALYKCARETSFIEKLGNGDWQLTGEGEAEMKRRALTGGDA